MSGLLSTPQGNGLLAQDGWGDPRSKGNMLIALAQALSPRNKFAAGLMNYGDRVAGAQDNDLRRKSMMMRMEADQLGLERAKREAEAERQMQDAAQGSMISPERATALSMGPMPDGSVVPQVQPGFDTKAFLSRLYAINPLKAAEMERSLAKDNKPLTVAPGASLVDPRTLKPVFTAPKEEATPAAIREYQFAQSQGYKGTFEQWDTARKRAGASNVSMSVNAEKPLLNEIAGGLGKSLVDAKGGAQAALSTIGTVNRLMDAIDSGKVIAGPGTTFRQFGLQIGGMLGVSGQNAQEKLLNTRQAIQSLAQLELDAAQQMKGQGQITEAERAIIRRAASGDIDGMTVPELKVLGGILDRTARSKIRGFNSQVKPLISNPNAAPLAPFLSVEEPPQRQAPNVLRFDAQGNPVR